MNIQLSTIRMDGGTQSRAAIDPDTVNEYADRMRDGDTFPAITVYYDGADYWLADGFHRVHAARKAERMDFAADVRQGTRRDAVLHSVGANGTHGLRRSNADKQQAAMTLLNDEEWSGWSDREIARRCGVSNRFISNLRGELVTVNGSQLDERQYTTKHGTVATMHTASIGTRPTPISTPAPIHRIPVDDYDTAPDEPPAVQVDDDDDLTPYEQQLAARYEADAVPVADDDPPPTDVAPVVSPLVDRQPTALAVADSPRPMIDQRTQQRNVLTSQASMEWYTPAWCIQAVHAALGAIDLDPASSHEANQTVKAARFYTLADDGLARTWDAPNGAVFVNPPYNNRAAVWCTKAVQEYDAGAFECGILLVFSKLGYTWFEELWARFPVCFVRRRISFRRPQATIEDMPNSDTEADDVRPDGEAKHASAFVYLGKESSSFQRVFSEYGRVILPEVTR